MRRMIRWTLLVIFAITSLFYLNSAAYCAWVSGGPPNDYPEWWLQRSIIHLCLALTAAAVGVVLFVVLGAAKKSTKIRMVVGGVVVITALLLWPPLREFWHQDSCLDSGGAWDESMFQCLRELPLESRP